MSIMLVLILFQIFGAVWAGVPTRTALSQAGTEYSDQIVQEKVKFQYFYEPLCPYCRDSYVNCIKPMVQELGDYLEITTYPYGNANMELNGTELKIECQHGPEECYGNMLHACAIDILKDITKYVPFNSCMIEKESDDEAADTCGKELNIDPEPIIYCAQDIRGFELLLHYGLEGDKVNYPGVPWWLINGDDKDIDSEKPLKQLICEAFKNPPEPCKECLKCQESERE